MRYKYLFLLLIPVLLLSCKKEIGYGPGTNNPSSVPPDTPVLKVLLKDLTIPLLPSPYYHFEYDTTGRVLFASFASGFTMYDFVYTGSRLSEMRNNTFGNSDKLEYIYDDQGRVIIIRYTNPLGEAYKRIFLTYDGQKLVKLERGRESGPGFVIEKTMTFLYYDDGNLKEITDHRHAIQATGQGEQTFFDRFEQYDNKVNTDGFSLLHNEFFDHLVFLPAVQLQKNNPGKLTRSGDGILYEINYTYTYNDKDAPLAKTGHGTWLSGPHTGEAFPSNTLFSYY